MKTKFFTCAILALLTLSTVSCGSQQPVTQVQKPVSSFSGNYNAAPDAETDTKEYFVGTGFSYGSRVQKSVLQRTALTNAQNIIRQKLQHSYEGMITDYMNNYSNDKGSDIQAKIEAAGTQVINAIIGDTYESATAKFSDVDEKGNVECVVNVRVYKNELVDKLAKKVSEDLSADEKMKIDFKENEFRQKMESKFEKFSENK